MANAFSAGAGAGLKFIKSLRFRFLIILIAIGIVPAVIASRSVVTGYEQRAISLRTMSVRNQCDILVDQLLEADYVNDPSNSVISSELAMLSNVYNGRIMVIDSTFRVIHDTFDLGVGRFNVSEQVINCFQGEGASTVYDEKNNYIEIAVPLEKDSEIRGVLLVSVSTNEIAQNAQILERRSTYYIAVISALVLVVGYLLAAALIRPVSRIANEIEEVTDGYQDEKLSVTDYTETQQITDAFNRMLQRVKVVDDSRQEFVQNVSHELKTPLTSMKVLADSLIGQENIPEEMYQEFMQDISREIDRENGIIQDLLVMVRMDKKAADMNVKPVDIGAMLENIVSRLNPIAGKRNIELVLDTFGEVTAEIDESRLVLAFTNLIENGIKYNVEDGWVRISLNADHRYFYVTVADSGVGIAEEDQEFIFERFYRADKSHSTEIEGTGLGLAIVRSAILLHHGVIKVNSRPGEGTTFQVRIPMQYQKGENE